MAASDTSLPPAGWLKSTSAPVTLSSLISNITDTSANQTAENEDPAVIAAQNQLQDAQAAVQAQAQNILTLTAQVNQLSQINSAAQASYHQAETCVVPGLCSVNSKRTSAAQANTNLVAAQNELQAANTQSAQLQQAVVTATAAVTQAQNNVLAQQAAAGQLALTEAQATASTNPQIIQAKAALQTSLSSTKNIELIIIFVAVLIAIGLGIYLIKSDNIKL